MKFALLLGLLFSSVLSFATDEGVIEIRVKAENGWGEIATYLAGWTCSAASTVNYQEKLADHTGEYKFVDRISKNQYLFSFLNRPEVKMNFRKDMSVTSKVIAQISESCTRTVVEEKERLVCATGNINCHMEKYEENKTETMYLDWNCSFKTFPKNEREVVKTTCTADPFSVNSALYKEVLAAAFAKKKISASMTLKKRYESFAVDLCKGKNLEKRKVIKLTQGIDGLWLENDFVVMVKIAGMKKTIQLKKDNGVFNDEIAICRDEDIKLTVSAIEEDLIWDDIYSCSDGSCDTVTLSTKDSKKASAKIKFIRNNKWDKLFLDKKQEIKLEIREAPIQ